MSQIKYEDILEDSAIPNQLIDYYNGLQKEYVVRLLDGLDEHTTGRQKWKEKGINPRFRNIFKSIVDKSGQLYNSPPALELWRNGNAFQDQLLNQLMESCDWKAFNQNADVYTRFLKSTVVYLERHVGTETMTVNGQYSFDSASGDALVPMLLHKGNCAVNTDVTGSIIELAYLSDYDLDEGYMHELREQNMGKKPVKYVRVTPETIEEWVWTEKMKDQLVAVEPNPHGMVTAYFRHDTNKPMYRTWNVPALDLKDLQDIYNLQLSDMEFALAWQKQKTLVTNADMEGSEADAGYIPIAPMGHSEPGAIYKNKDFYQNKKPQPTIGLGAMIKLGQTDDGTPATATYIGPETDLMSQQELMRALVKDFAQDWDVNIELDNGSVTSGFQLVVKELHNLNLRDRRAQFAAAAHKAEYTILKAMYPALPEADLYIKFPPPALPTNPQDEQNLWDQKISQGRASIIDYFMETENLTEEEAINKAIKIQQMNARFKAMSAPVVAPVINMMDGNNPIDNA